MGERSPSSISLGVRGPLGARILGTIRNQLGTGVYRCV